MMLWKKERLTSGGNSSALGERAMNGRFEYSTLMKTNRQYFFVRFF